MVEFEIARITVASLTKFYAAITVAFTILFGWPVLFLDVAIPGVGIGTFLVMILFAIVGGVIGGAVSAVIYNLVAASVGGLVVDLDAREADALAVTDG